MLSNRFYTRNLPRCLLQQNKQPTNQECPRHDVPYQNYFALSSHPKITGEANHPVSHHSWLVLSRGPLMLNLLRAEEIRFNWKGSTVLKRGHYLTIPIAKKKKEEINVKKNENNRNQRSMKLPNIKWTNFN